jgi:hypothetical protein
LCHLIHTGHGLCLLLAILASGCPTSVSLCLPLTSSFHPAGTLSCEVKLEEPPLRRPSLPTSCCIILSISPRSSPTIDNWGRSRPQGSGGQSHHPFLVHPSPLISHQTGCKRLLADCSAGKSYTSAKKGTGTVDVDCSFVSRHVSRSAEGSVTLSGARTPCDQGRCGAFPSLGPPSSGDRMGGSSANRIYTRHSMIHVGQWPMPTVDTRSIYKSTSGPWANVLVPQCHEGECDFSGGALKLRHWSKVR